MSASTRSIGYKLRKDHCLDSGNRVSESGLASPGQISLLHGMFPASVYRYPQLRFMGSKFRLLPWIHKTLSELQFTSTLDAFSGSGCVGYLFKSMGKQVFSNDFLNLSATVARALVENDTTQLNDGDVEALLEYDPKHKRFIEQTFSGIFYTPDDLRFLDRISWNIRRIRSPYKRALGLAALIRACAKRQPRGVFTVAGDPEHYKDNRRDLKLSIREHFLEQVVAYNNAVTSNEHCHKVTCGDVFSWEGSTPDLVYMDPPYVPRADDNCYIKRYHFLEGLSCYWDGMNLMPESRVKKLEKRFTPFSYRRTAMEAFDSLFRKFADSILVLSYSSNGYPDLEELRTAMRRYKARVDVVTCEHRYHFGTHAAAKRTDVLEYLIVGT